MAQPPSLILVHGAATGAWVWDAWRRHLGALGWEVNVLDLRGHGRSLPIDLATVTMEDYLGDLESVTGQIEAARGAHPIVCGWSMGGMLAMMYATKHNATPALILLEPSPPVEISGRVAPEVVRKFSGDVLGPEAFGVFPDNRELSRLMLFDLTDAEIDSFLNRSAGVEESGLAFRQNLRGMSIAQGVIGCPVLVLFGETAERAAIGRQNRELASHLDGECLALPDAGHWGIVYSDRLVAETAPQVDAWLRRVLD